MLSFSEIFDIKVADAQTHRQTDTLTDNKGCLKLAARELIIIQHLYCAIEPEDKEAPSGAKLRQVE